MTHLTVTDYGTGERYNTSKIAIAAALVSKLGLDAWVTDGLDLYSWTYNPEWTPLLREGVLFRLPNDDPDHWVNQITNILQSTDQRSQAV